MSRNCWERFPIQRTLDCTGMSLSIIVGTSLSAALTSLSPRPPDSLHQKFHFPTPPSRPPKIITNFLDSFLYDTTTAIFTSAGGAGLGGTEQMSEGVDWLYWLGAWGDEEYPTSDSRQNCLFGECHYVSGPTGPLAKNLERTSVCQKDECTILTSI